MASTSSSTPSAADQARPWWRYPIVWMVIAGPLAVVVASLFTAGVAIRHVDPVLDTSDDHISKPSEAPAIKARNHAADPEKLVPEK
ncbi:MAG: nitrogen fixation protein FixH [Aquabacterium sp.]